VLRTAGQSLAEQSFVGEGEIPPIRDEVKIEASQRHIQADEMITGKKFEAKVGDPLKRIEVKLKNPEII
jgi:hypothetical protein